MATTEALTQGVHSFEVPGVMLSYAVKGEGPLLVIQAAGWGISSRYLQIGFAPLEKHFTLIFLEPRGSGLSSRPPREEDMSTMEMADDVERLRQHLGLSKIDLLGHSNGGTIVLGYAQRHPEGLNKLILLTHWLDGYDDSTTWNAFKEAKRHNPDYADAVAAIEREEKAIDPPPTTDDEFRIQCSQQFAFYVAHPRDHLPTFLEAMGTPSLWVNRAQHVGDKLHPMPQFDDLPKVKATTLVIGADQDTVCSANVSRITHEGVAGSKLVVIKDCGHFPWIEKPNEFFPLVIDFLK